MTGIGAWNASVDEKLQQADNEIGKVREWLEGRKRETEANVKQEQIKFEEELQRMRLQLKTDQLAKKNQNVEMHQALTNKVQAKLPELVITKFDGSYMDWPRFWGQFSETIDKTSRTIEALPFTAEGYNCAKSILSRPTPKKYWNCQQ